MIRLYFVIGSLLLFGQLAVGQAVADQSIRHGAVEFFLGDSKADAFSVSVDRQADGIEPTVLMRSNPTRLVIQTSGQAFQGGKSFRLKGAAISGVYFIDRVEGDLVVVQIANDARVLFEKEPLADSRFRLNFSLQAPAATEKIVQAGPSPTPTASTEPAGQSTEEFLQGIGKVLLPKRRDTLAMPELDGLDAIDFDDSALLDSDTLDKLTKGVEGVGSQNAERVLQIHVDAPAPTPQEEWLVPGLIAATTVSWAFTLMLLFQRTFGSDRKRRRKRPQVEPPGGEPFGAKRPIRKTARQLLVESYATLGLKTTDSDDDVKTRYKHLVKVFHADTLGSRDLPEEMLELANQQFRLIQAAYEAVKQHRGMQ